ncbi:MAG TPA: PAS domain-containing protein, partial [Thermoanaerobaculia bacterium]|nr:PAS domain-containing protein [Thermoanaerobaculia bacterium]
MSAYAFSPFAIPGAVTAVAVILFAILVLLTRYSRTSVAVFGMSVAVAAWQAAWAFMYLAVEARTALGWAKVGVAFAPFVAVAAYQFFDSILQPANHRRIIAGAGWLVAAQFAILTLATDSFVSGVRRYGWGFSPTLTVAAGLLYPLFLAGVIAAIVFEIVRAYPASEGTERSRMRLFAIALAIGSIATVDLIPMYGVPLYPFGWAAVLACAGVAIYTVAKHGMVPINPSLAATEIIGTMRDLLLVSDRDGRIRFANNAACAFLGYSREDIIGRHLEDLLIPRGGNEPQPLQGWVRDREYVFRTKMGQPIELTLSHSPVMHQGEVTGAVIIGRDLRERKRYEWEARRAVTLLESTLDSTADGILVIGSDGRILTWNQRFVDLWGIPEEFLEKDDDDHGLIGHLVDQLIDPAEFLNSLAALHEHPEVESVNVLEFKDGRRFEQYSIGRYLDNAPLRVWSFRDVTARLAAEEAVRESEARYRLLFEQNAAGVCLATASGKILDCNATFAEMVGYPVEELTKRELGDVFQRPAAVEEIRRHLDGTPTVRGLEIEMKRRDGQRVSALANVSLVGRDDSALLHMTA